MLTAYRLIIKGVSVSFQQPQPGKKFRGISRKKKQLKRAGSAFELFLDDIKAEKRLPVMVVNRDLRPGDNFSPVRPVFFFRMKPW